MILSTNPVGEDNWTFKHFFKDDREKRFVLDDKELYEKRIIVSNDTIIITQRQMIIFSCQKAMSSNLKN